MTAAEVSGVILSHGFWLRSRDCVVRVPIPYTVTISP